MVLKGRKGNQKFEEVISSVFELREFIKINCEFINPEHERCDEVYANLVKLDKEIKGSLLNWEIRGMFKFKFKRPNTFHFWEERGYGLKEFNKYNNVKLSKIIDGEFFDVTFNKYTYKSFGKPTCNLCSSELKTVATAKGHLIDSCSNHSCTSNTNLNIKKLRWLAYLPLKMYESFNTRVRLDYKNHMEFWLLRGYSYEGSLAKSEEFKTKARKLKKNSIEHLRLISEMSIEESKDLLISRTQYSEAYWLNKGYSSKEAKERVSELQKGNSLKLYELKKKYPEEYKAMYTTKVEYWLSKGYPLKEAKEKLLERQTTFSREICIQKYGEVEGLKIFTDRQIRWSESLSKNGNMKCGHSKISQDLFNKILESYSDNESEYVKFATRGGELKLKKFNGGIYMYDFVDEAQKKIIEFHGDMFHGNPNKYKANDRPNPFDKSITAKEMWEKDKQKRMLAEIYDYEVLVIWDYDYRKLKKSLTMDKCLKFLNKK